MIMKKTITTVLGIMFLASFFSAMTLRQHYTRTMPEALQTESGRTIPVGGNYGKTVYVTLKEKRVLELAYSGVGLSAALFVTVAICFAKRTARKP
jgi:hypothetical protein